MLVHWFPSEGCAALKPYRLRRVSKPTSKHRQRACLKMRPTGVAETRAGAFMVFGNPTGRVRPSTTAGLRHEGSAAGRPPQRPATEVGVGMPSGLQARRASRTQVLGMNVYFVVRYSSMPSSEPSRPMPDCLTPPKGAAALEMTPALRPIIPVSSRSIMRMPRFRSCV